MDSLRPDDLLLMRAADGVATPEERASLAGRDAEIGALVGLGEQVRAAVAGGADVTDGVMAAVALNEAVRGPVDLADAVMASVALGDAVCGPVDLADGIMAAVALNEAVRHPVDVADAVLAQVGERVTRMPRWASLGLPVAAIAGLAAAAAALLVALLPGSTTPTQITATVAEPVYNLARLNQAEVEEISVAEDATVQVVQFEQGGPTFILVGEEAG